MELSKLIILVGISGSGKSTWINSLDLEALGIRVVSADGVRKELYDNISCQAFPNVVWSIVYERVADYLVAGYNVILDATHVRAKDRVSVLTYLNEKGIEFEAYAKVFESIPELSKERIKADLDSGVDRCIVSDKSIDKQFRQLTASIKSIEAEGFKLYA